MKFPTELHSNSYNFEKNFTNFIAITGNLSWQKRAESLSQQISANPFIRELMILYHENELLVYELMKRRKRGKKIHPKKLDVATYRLWSFIATTNNVYKNLTPVGKARLAGCIKSGLDDDYGLHSFIYEMSMAANLVSNSFDICCNDIENDGGPDFIATKDEIVVEVECKSFTQDKGRQVHNIDGYALCNELADVIKLIAGSNRTGVFIHITMRGRLTSSMKQHQEINFSLNEMWKNNIELCKKNEFSIELKDFKLTNSPFESEAVLDSYKRDDIVKYIFNEFNINNEFSFFYFSPRKSAVILIIDSEKPNKVIDRMYQDLKKPATKQLTGDNPGSLFVNLVDISPSELLLISGDDKSEEGGPSVLQLISTRLLKSEKRQSLLSVNFTSNSAPDESAVSNAPAGTSVWASNGHVYSFPNLNNKYASDERYKLFRS